MFDTGLLIFSLVLFVAVVFGLEGAYLWWNNTRGPEARRMQKRLDDLARGGEGIERTSLLKTRVLAQSPKVAELLQRMPYAVQIDRLLVQGGLSLSLGSLVGRSAALAVLGLVAALLVGLPLVLCVIPALGAGAMPLLYVLRVRRKRLATFDDNLAECIDLMARALRAGHAFPTALKLIGDEMPGAAGAEFRTTHDEVNFGVPVSDALLNLIERVPSADLKYFVVAVMIQRETGGNLAEVLDNISGIVRSRIKLIGLVRTLSAEGRLSAWILGLMPFGVALIIWMMNHTFLSPLWSDPIGPPMIGGMLTMMVVGAWWMSRIIQIRV